MKDIIKWFRNHKILNIIIACIIAISIALSLSIYYYNLGDNIYIYQNKQDKKFIKKLFKENWYWLVAGNSSYNKNYVENILNYKSPTGTNKNKETLEIYLYKEDNKPVAMVAFYKVKVYEGAILFLGVNKNYRGKGYARKLLNFGLSKLKSQNVSIVRILTRTDNKAALQLYKKLGFEKVWTDGSYVRLIKKL